VFEVPPDLRHLIISKGLLDPSLDLALETLSTAERAVPEKCKQDCNDKSGGKRLVSPGTMPERNGPGRCPDD
jgi:hypothetical protein